MLSKYKRKKKVLSEILKKIVITWKILLIVFQNAQKVERSLNTHKFLQTIMGYKFWLHMWYLLKLLYNYGNFPKARFMVEMS